MTDSKTRRDFLATLATSMAGTALIGNALSCRANETVPRPPLTVQDVIDLIVREIPGSVEDTIDTLKVGDPKREVTGIVTTFLATFDVLKKTKEIGANLVLTHEPTWYNHNDFVDQLVGDPVYQAKLRFAEQHQISIWRFHDYWHLVQPDPVIHGVARRLGLKILDPDDETLFEMQPTTFEELCNRCKENIGITHLRVVGDPGMTCRKIGLFVGWGGAMGEDCCGSERMEQVAMLSRKGADVVICGESAEWTACEYARDARSAGIPRGLIILGHSHSEEPGMEDVVEWLRSRLPGVAVTHVAAGDPFRWI